MNFQDIIKSGKTIRGIAGIANETFPQIVGKTIGFVAILGIEIVHYLDGN